jgi:hypothetical protein
MSTLVSWFEARLKATNGVVKEFRVAFLPAGMATRQPVHTMHVTATFKGKPEEVVWIRNGNGCVCVSRELKLEVLPMLWLRRRMSMMVAHAEMRPRVAELPLMYAPCDARDKGTLMRLTSRSRRRSPGCI